MTINKSPEKIQSMFDKISDKYDFINNLMSFGTHFLIKKNCVNLLDKKSDLKILDLCCGTGDLTRILKKRFPNAEIIGVDFSEKMLEIARNKEVSKARGIEGWQYQFTEKLQPFNPLIDNVQSLDNCHTSIPPYLYTALYLQADATILPFSDNSFDIITIGFGLRNIENLNGALSEIYRVLKKDGQFLHLDFGEKNLLNKMFDKIIPNIVKIFTKNKEAYMYLIKSKQEFLSPDDLINVFKQNGLKFILRKDYFLGAISCQIMNK